MTSHPGHQTIAIHTLPNILRSKVNQTMKFDQSIEYNKRNIFFKKNFSCYVLLTDQISLSNAFTS